MGAPKLLSCKGFPLSGPALAETKRDNRRQSCLRLYAKRGAALRIRVDNATGGCPPRTVALRGIAPVSFVYRNTLSLYLQGL
jgi:hypothetical protein